MQLTSFTDYSLRVLVLLRLRGDERVTTAEAAEIHGLSHAHLAKVVASLAEAGFVESTRGRGGGLRLAKPPEEIRIGDVVRALEPHFHYAECFEPGKERACLLTPGCELRGLLADAGEAFLATLDGATLADLGKAPSHGRKLRGRS